MGGVFNLCLFETTVVVTMQGYSSLFHVVPIIKKTSNLEKKICTDIPSMKNEYQRKNRIMILTTIGRFRCGERVNRPTANKQSHSGCMRSGPILLIP